MKLVQRAPYFLCLGKIVDICARRRKRIYSSKSMKVDERRVFLCKDGLSKKGPVLYWMDRDQRVLDNWALLYAQEIAIQKREPLLVIFCLDVCDRSSLRQNDFMLRGLQEVQVHLAKKNIPFFLSRESSEKFAPYFLHKENVSVLISDFSPLREIRNSKKKVMQQIDIPFYEVDAHNIVPARFVSHKVEFGAYTIRPKLNKLFEEFCTSFPSLKRHPIDWKKNVPIIDWRSIKKSCRGDVSVLPTTISSGEKEAHKRLKEFLKKGLALYEKRRNDPTVAGTSSLSPYLHFGHIAPQRVVLELLTEKKTFSRDAFLEEVFVRRELSDNFCLYNSFYDKVEGFPTWAQKTLKDHEKDPRKYLYSLSLLSKAQTHDSLWNAAQRELVDTGKLHGYLRMYWAKKILEWSPSPKEALKRAIFLNDKYALDGRDPNGYVGIAWSIGGVHDRAWGERAIFGKIRYMSLEGMKKKFSVANFLGS